MNSFSPNMLKIFQQCPQKFYFKYIRNISVPQKISFFEKGKKIHALANYYLKNENITEFEKILSAEEYDIWQRLKQNEYIQKECVVSEYNLSCKVGKYWIGGRIDAIVKDENQYYILDYKTGSIPKNPQMDFQTIVYLLCASKFFKEKTSFVYIDLKNNINHKIDLNDITLYEQKIINICSEIEQTVKSNVYSKKQNCSSCEYNKLC